MLLQREPFGIRLVEQDDFYFLVQWRNGGLEVVMVCEGHGHTFSIFRGAVVPTVFIAALVPSYRVYQSTVRQAHAALVRIVHGRRQ